MKSKHWLIIFSFYLVYMSIANAQMSLNQKIGQMLMVGFCGTTLHDNDPIVKDILAQRIGGVVLYDKNVKTQQTCNIENPKQLKQLTDQLQKITLKAAEIHHNHLYPLLIAIDYEGGKVVNLKTEKGFPKTLSAEDLGKSTDAKAQQYAAQMAKTLQDLGINFDFAPVLDVNVNANNPVIAKYGRSFSKDPEQVVKYAGIFSHAFHEAHILCAYKHFPGHGSAEKDSHLGLVDLSRTWKTEELIPYQALFKDPNSCDLVMTAHILNQGLDKNNYPATLSYAMTTELLRKQLGFKGTVVTDDLQMGAISKYYELTTITQLAIGAGADILLFSNQLVETPQNTSTIMNTIAKEVRERKISENRITDAYHRVMKLKEGLDMGEK